MRQRKTPQGVSDEAIEEERNEERNEITGLIKPIGTGNSWNVFSTAVGSRSQATLEWTIGDVDAGSIRVTIDDPTESAIDRLADLAEHFAGEAAR